MNQKGQIQLEAIVSFAALMAFTGILMQIALVEKNLLENSSKSFNEKISAVSCGIKINSIYSNSFGKQKSGNENCSINGKNTVLAGEKEMQTIAKELSGFSIDGKNFISVNQNEHYK